MYFLPILNVFLLIIRLTNSIDIKKEEPTIKTIYKLKENSCVMDHTKNRASFCYNNMTLAELTKLKMPYINCNLDIFNSSDNGFVDLFLSCNVNSFIRFQLKIEGCISKNMIFINAIKHLIGDTSYCTISSSSEFEYSQENFLGAKLFSNNMRYLNDRFVEIDALMKDSLSSLDFKTKILCLLEEADNYIFEEFSNDIFLSQLKPSLLFKSIDIEKILGANDFIITMKTLLYIYMFINGFFVKYNNDFLIRDISLFSKDLLTPLTLKNDIHAKYLMMLYKNSIILYIGSAEASRFSSLISIYSINADNLMDKFTLIIRDIIIKKSSEAIYSDVKIMKTCIPNEMFSSSYFDSYEVSIDNSIAVIMKFDLKYNTGFPSGISTAYLNLNNHFKALGYLGIGGDDGESTLFISVEEKMDFFFKSNNFSVFVENDYQIYFFVLDFLNILEAINAYKIVLESSTILFSVNNNSKRWRFRVDDIGNFFYDMKENPTRNLEVLLNVLGRILLVIRNQNILEYFIHFKDIATNIKDTMDKNYSRILIELIDQEIIKHN